MYCVTYVLRNVQSFTNNKVHYYLGPLQPSFSKMIACCNNCFICMGTVTLANFIVEYCADIKGTSNSLAQYSNN